MRAFVRPTVGEVVPDLIRRIDLTDLVAYGAATWDWHRLHYDPVHARRAGLPEPVVDGQMFGALLAEQVTRFVGDAGRLTRLHFRNRAPVFPGSEVRCQAVVTDADADGFVVAQTILCGEEIVVAPAGAHVCYS